MANVLVADDVIDIAELLQMVFKSKGHCVDISSNGVDALRKITAQDYDIVITDIMMPGCDGIEVVKFIRTNLPPQKRNIPIIAISGDCYNPVVSSIALKAAEIHADYVFTKPFCVEEIERAFDKLIALPAA